MAVARKPKVDAVAPDTTKAAKPCTSPLNGAQIPVAASVSTRFKKGASGNAKGSNPKQRFLAALKQQLKKGDARAVVQTMVKIAKDDKNPATAINAFAQLAKAVGLYDEEQHVTVIRQELVFEDRKGGGDGLRPQRMPKRGAAEAALPEFVRGSNRRPTYGEAGDDGELPKWPQPRTDGSQFPS